MHRAGQAGSIGRNRLLENVKKVVKLLYGHW